MSEPLSDEWIDRRVWARNGTEGRVIGTFRGLGEAEKLRYIGATMSARQWWEAQIPRPHTPLDGLWLLIECDDDSTAIVGRNDVVIVPRHREQLRRRR